MTALSDDIAAMLRSVDDGDDAVLPYLADALEESGDPRAAGVRIVVSCNHWPRHDKVHDALGSWIWFRCRDKRSFPFRHFLSPEEYDRLEGGHKRAYWMHYKTRSSAIMALAEALSEPDKE